MVRQNVARNRKGTIEEAVATAVKQFHKDQQGRGPSEVQVHLVSCLIVVRCSGILTPTEAHLSPSPDGRKLVKSARQELHQIVHKDIEGIIAGIVGCHVLRSYCDTNVLAAEQVEVYVLEHDVEKRLLRADLDQYEGAGIKRS
jgi:uncharacterized protein YbcI